MDINAKRVEVVLVGSLGIGLLVMQNDRHLVPIAAYDKNGRHCEKERRSNLTTIAITHSSKIASLAEKAFSQ